MRRRDLIAGAGAVVVASAFQRAGAESASSATVSGARAIVNGREIRLSDILAPAMAGGRADPYAAQFQRALADTLSHPVRAEESGAADRWNRPFTRLYVEHQRGVMLATAQERLVACGAARTLPESSDHAFIRRLLLLEEAARRTRIGLWGLAPYRVHPADDARRAVGDYNLVEGAPVTAVKRGGRVYLNFGDDYRKDFTASAKSGLARAWAKTGLDLETLAGAPLRIRGHVAWINGPSIDLTHPLQIELLKQAA
ncbi:MAG: thermonuclease family protein [Amphiplicatus sp.]